MRRGQTQEGGPQERERGPPHEGVRGTQERGPCQGFRGPRGQADPGPQQDGHRQEACEVGRRAAVGKAAQTADRAARAGAGAVPHLPGEPAAHVCERPFLSSYMSLKGHPSQQLCAYMAGLKRTWEHRRPCGQPLGPSLLLSYIIVIPFSAIVIMWHVCAGTHDPGRHRALREPPGPLGYSPAPLLHGCGASILGDVLWTLPGAVCVHAARAALCLPPQHDHVSAQSQPAACSLRGLHSRCLALPLLTYFAQALPVPMLFKGIFISTASHPCCVSGT